MRYNVIAKFSMEVDGDPIAGLEDADDAREHVHWRIMDYVPEAEVYSIELELAPSVQP